jgi:hypothetical protein
LHINTKNAFLPPSTMFKDGGESAGRESSIYHLKLVRTGVLEDAKLFLPTAISVKDK